MIKLLLNNNLMLKKVKLRWLILLTCILLLIVAFNQSLTVTYYTLTSDKLKENTSMNIVLISDLHSTIYGKEQKNLIEKVKNINPDIILLAGDIADDDVPIEGTELFLEGVKDIAPIYYVTGNHEYWSNDIDSIRKTINSYGVVILSDNYTQTTINGMDLIIAGIEDPDKKEYESPEYNQSTSIQKAFSDLGIKEGYKILVAHRPEKIE